MITATVACHACGAEISAIAETCPHCGARQFGAARAEVSGRTILVAALLCFFLGPFGAHRFYVGKIGTGILQLVTLGGLGIWALVDMIFVLTGQFRDKEGRRLQNWT